MKDALKSYFSFHRSQRMGLLILMGLLLLLLIVLTMIHQPVSSNASQPDTSAETITKNEFSTSE